MSFFLLVTHCSLLSFWYCSFTMFFLIYRHMSREGLGVHYSAGRGLRVEGLDQNKEKQHACS